MATIVGSVVGGNWTDGLAWVGGSAPTSADNAQLTALSGNITVNTGAVARSLDCTGYTGTLTHTAGVTLTLGDGSTGASNIGLKLVSGMTYSLGSGTSSQIDFFSSSTTPQTITTAGKTLGPIRFSNFDGNTSYVLTDALICDTITHRGGTFNTANFSVTCTTFGQGSGTGKTFALGSSTITITGTGNVWNPNSTIQASNATFILTAVSASTKTFVGAGSTYLTITHTVAGSTGKLVIDGSNTIGTLNFSDSSNARTLEFTAGTTNTFTTFTVNGTASKLMTIQSSSSGSAATVSKSTGTVSCDYLSIKDSTATGGASWYAGANSTSVSGNTGWTFTAPPPAGGPSMSRMLLGIG